MKKKLLLFAIFGCLGITSEIFFTAICNFIKLSPDSIGLALKLEGNSYIWMFFIYGLAAIIFPILFNRIKKYHIIFRLLLYTVIIFSIEFITGWILDITTGQCPWEYHSPLAVCGYINLYYTPFWAGFGFLLEKVYLFFSNLIEKGMA